MRTPPRALVTGALALVLAAGAACTSDDAASSSSAPSTAASSPAGPTSSSAGPASPSSPSQSRSGRPSTTSPVSTPPVPPPPSGLTTVPSTSVATRPPVPISSPATFARGVRVALVSHRQVKVTDRGPGALTGKPATEFTLRFVNDSTRRVRLGTVQVGVTYGAGQSASPANLDDRVAHGTLAPGAEATAVYTFAFPSGNAGTVRVEVWLSSQFPVVVFEGSLR